MLLLCYMILFVPEPSIIFSMLCDCVIVVTVTVMSHYNPNSKSRIK